jgi:hypothetical protein
MMIQQVIADDGLHRNLRRRDRCPFRRRAAHRDALLLDRRVGSGSDLDLVRRAGALVHKRKSDLRVEGPIP